jgi:hypothetical protein
MKNVFIKNKYKVNQKSLTEISEENFPESLKWIYGFLLFFPLYDQSEREAFYNELPVKIKDQIRVKYKYSYDDIVDWLGTGEFGKEKKYTSDIFELLELDEVHSESEEMDSLRLLNEIIKEKINSKVELRNIYKENESKISISEDLAAFSSIIILLHSNSVKSLWEQFDSDLKHKVAESIMKGRDLLVKIEIGGNEGSVIKSKFLELIELSKKYFESFFSDFLGL